MDKVQIIVERQIHGVISVMVNTKDCGSFNSGSNPE